MKNFRSLWLLLMVSAFTLSACKKETNDPTSLTDIELLENINLASNGQGTDAFLLPDSDDYASIPQDPNNPITDDKVELGKLLYHETGLAINPRLPNGKFTYSCASCHAAQAGFYAGRRQGLGEGGLGFGAKGESRELDPSYPLAFIDVQPIKSPSALNVAYQEVMLWNGQFGANGLNVGTEAQWTAETPKFENNLGYDGVETQAIAGLAVHDC
ncbi:MAG: cytochrome c peroxidase [Bacteroidota bacterium]